MSTRSSASARRSRRSSAPRRRDRSTRPPGSSASRTTSARSARRSTRITRCGYAVAHFFANGGSEAVIVRVLGAGSAAAAVTLQSAESTAKNVLVLTASGAGAWANRLAGRGLDVTVDRAGSANPADLFNVVLT